MSTELDPKVEFDPKAGFEKSVDIDKSLSFSELGQNSLGSQSFFQDSERNPSNPPLDSIEKSEPGENRGLDEAFFQENSECPNASFTVKFFNTFEERTELNLKPKIKEQESDQYVIIKSPSQTFPKPEDNAQVHPEHLPVTKSKNCCKRLCILF